MGRWEYFIDAKTGEIIYKANRIYNANDIGTGIGVMGDTVYHLDTHNNGSSYIMVDYTRRLINNPHGHDGEMPSTSYLQTNIASASLPGTVASDADNYWYDASQSPAVSGHIYTALMYDWLLKDFNQNSYNDAGASMLTVVNYSAEGDNNAYWDGSRIVVWSYSTGWRSLAGCPDVIAHEWGHAVTEYNSNLVYQKEPGALNESFSDMIGAAFEFAHDSMDVPDWFMGENGRTTGTPFRSMSNPHAYGDPDYYGTSDPYWVDVVNCTPSYLNDYCGVHTNSGVGNKWFYLLSDGGTHHDITVTGIGVANAIQIACYANVNYWTSSTDYYNAALGTISAANDLDPSGAWATQAALAWNAVGVSTPAPSLTFSYPNGKPSVVTPDQTTTFQVVVSGFLGGTPVQGSGRLYYSINGAAYTDVFMTQTSPNNYDATLPAVGCNDELKYYVGAREASSTMFFDPADTSNAYSALVATEITVIFEDDFQTNKGWTVSSTATAGQWQRGTPAGGGLRGDPPTDFDGSGQCYLTGNASGDSDVDGGTTTLTSPAFDLSGNDAQIHYARWYSNDFGAAPNTDTFKVLISNNNGSSWTLVEKVGPTNQASGGWYEYSFWVSSLITPSSQMKLRFEASDLGDGSVVEAAIDDVSVTSYECNTNVPSITTNDVPDWTIGVAYSSQLEVVGGVGPLTWSDKNSNLAGTGLTISSSGLLAGVPSTTGAISFTALVIDSVGSSDEQLYTFAINPNISIITDDVSDWTINRPYTFTLQSTGGTAPGTWSDKFSNLSGTGLTLSSAGILSGTPTSSGVISFTAYIADFVGDSDEKEFSFTINPAIQIATDSLPSGREDSSFSQQLASTGGTGTATWTDKNNNLSGTGLTLSSTGLLSGTPIDSGIITFTAKAADVAGSYGEKLFSFRIKPAYICGDANGNGIVNIQDVTYLITHLYKAGPAPIPPDAGDANGSGGLNIQDITYLINYLYKSGPAPICP
jgi:Zn-dependent metalloprotease